MNPNQGAHRVHLQRMHGWFALQPPHLKQLRCGAEADYRTLNIITISLRHIHLVTLTSFIQSHY